MAAGDREDPPAAFADRLASLVEERRSQICLGLDPDPEALTDPSADAVADWSIGLIEKAGPACVAVKPQLACFEQLGAAGWGALERTVAAARDAGLLVIADGKRGDVPHTAAVYARSLLAPAGSLPGGGGLGADAATVNPLLGADALEPFLEEAQTRGSGLFALVRTSNPGAADIQDLDTPSGPVHERLARLVGESGGALRGECGLSGMGAVVGATRPEHLARLRELMPDAVFLVPGVGAQGGRPTDLAPAFAPGPAAAIVAAARSITGAGDPKAAAEALRAEVWETAGGR